MSNGIVYEPGARIIRREVLHGRLWMHHPVTVVEDDGEHLVVLLEPGSRFTFHPHPFDPHPWSQQDRWQGPQVLQVHRNGDPYSVWRFFDDGVFRYWYVNFEAPIVRHRDAFDTDDHGLDLIIHPDGSADWKDVDHLSDMRAAGRMSAAQVLGVLDAAHDVSELLRSGTAWWHRWADWYPSD